MTISGDRWDTDEQPKLAGRRRIKARWVVLLVLTVIVVSIGVSEHQRPGVFYDVVWTRVQGLGDLADWGEGHQNRILAADLARDAAAWPGVVRVGWPDVQGVDGNFARMDRQLADFTVVVDPSDGDIRDLAARAFAESSAAAHLGVRLDITLQLDDLELAISDTAGENLDLALDIVEDVQSDPAVGEVVLSLAPDPVDSGALFELSVRTRHVDDADHVREDLCSRAEAARAQYVVCHVDGPREG